ncbi:MAG: hypothetical protein WD011_04495 [Nitriliruptoraceae bacterium]
MLHLAVVTGTTPPEGIDDATMATADDLLVTALSRHAKITEPSWRDDVDWSVFDAVLVRTVWDYVKHRDAFVAWAAEVGRVTPLWNPADVLRWNTHKGYLLELEERGAPVVATAWLAQGDRVDLAELAQTRGWTRLLLKPAVSTGSRGAHRTGARLGRDDQAHLDRLLATGDVLVQPYLDAVETTGERSVVVVGGRASHAVAKTPKGGDFRVQHEYGGRYRRIEVDDETRRLAEWIVESTGNDLLFARVDLLCDAWGTPQLVELEATEPDLYLPLAPDRVDDIAATVVAWCTRPSVSEAATNVG